ncbi:MAG: hypothetical protein WC768_04680 [Patescibacteria group bacterium]|jgi:hypothetical protein
MKTILKNKKFLALAIVLISLAAININLVLAQGQDLLGPEAQQALDAQDQAFLSQAGLGTDVSLGQVISFIIKIFLSFLGVLYVILIIYAGFLWMTSAGNEEKITKAKKIMTSAFIGLAIILAAYALTYYVIDNLLIATKGENAGLD